MSEITRYVGQRIRRSRKAKGLTIDEFSKMINKSKATVSKYENGSIVLDVETLLDIANALEMDIQMLINYKSPRFKPLPLPQDSFFNQPTFYLYYYDGRSKSIGRGQLDLSAAGENIDYIDLTMHLGLDDFSSVDKCQHIFEGKLRSYDTLSHMSLTNQINPAEKLYICLLNPTFAHSPAIGIMSGIATKQFFAPLAYKVIVSRAPLEENDAFRRVIEINKEDVHNFKHYNMMLVNQPGSLYLKEK